MSRVTFAFDNRHFYRDPKKTVMDYKYIEQLLERYWDAETTLEEENILRTFFSQKDLPAEMEALRPLFALEKEETLGDDFDERMMQMIGSDMSADSQQTPVAVKAREVTLTRQLMPLFKAAAVVAIILTLGGALQAPWDNNWNTPVNDYTSFQIDTVDIGTPVQAENIIDTSADSTSVLLPERPKN